MSKKRTQERTPPIVFAGLSTVSVLWFFIPAPLKHSEDLGFYVLGHLIVVWLSYWFSLTFGTREGDPRTLEPGEDNLSDSSNSHDELMARYDLTHDGEQYIYKGQRFLTIDDAVMYAKQRQ